jgi:putative RecB family exonuclease
LGVYGQAILANLGVLPETGVFIKAGRPATAKVAEKPTKDIKWSLHDWTPELLGSMFKDMDRAEKLGIFLPNPGEGCERTCTVAENCRVKGWGSERATFATITTRAA